MYKNLVQYYQSLLITQELACACTDGNLVCVGCSLHVHQSDIPLYMWICEYGTHWSYQIYFINRYKFLYRVKSLMEKKSFQLFLKGISIHLHTRQKNTVCNHYQAGKGNTLLYLLHEPTDVLLFAG